MHLNRNKVFVNNCLNYDDMNGSLLPDSIFSQINPGDKVVLKPNWVLESHKFKKDEWDYVITNPTIITAVLHKVMKRLSGRGRISIIDGPMTEASFGKLISHYPVEEWQCLADQNGIVLEIIDLRDYEWVMKNGIIIERKAIPGDPRGKVLINLSGESSEFWGHKKSKRGYYGADYDRSETNRAHDGSCNLYSVSRTVIESDVFINIPKLKTHAKAGLTCCLKNLVGVNTYKNYLPHHSEGSPNEGGDQFPSDNMNARLEGPLISFMKQHVLKNQLLARVLSPLKTLALRFFGDSSCVVRSGCWYGNDTLWRMILDLNKVLLYASPEGEMCTLSPLRGKRYIGIVDAVLAGEGNGPLSPDPVNMNYIICGTNPVAIDAICAVLMGFDPRKIKTIAKAFEIRKFAVCDFVIEQVSAQFKDGLEYKLDQLPPEMIVQFKPHFAWAGHIEKDSTKTNMGR